MHKQLCYYEALKASWSAYFSKLKEDDQNTVVKCIDPFDFFFFLIFNHYEQIHERFIVTPHYP